MEEFKGFLSAVVPPQSLQFDYSDHVRDPQQVYTVDCMVKAARKPLFIFGITNDNKCQTVTNIVYWWEKQLVPFDVTAIFENQEAINRKVLARFSDVCGRQFSNLPTNKNRIRSYLDEVLAAR